MERALDHAAEKPAEEASPVTSEEIRGGVDLKEFLESAPLEGVDLTRRKDLPRDVDL